MEATERYLANLKGEEELKNIVYHDLNDDNTILKDIREKTYKSNLLFEDNRNIINSIFDEIKVETPLNRLLEIQKFANELVDFYEAKDAELSLGIHSRLLEVAKKLGDLNFIVEELYYNVKCCFSISRAQSAELYSHLYDDIDYYKAHYFELNKKTRELFLKYYANETISIKTPEDYYKRSIDVALEYIDFARRKDVREKDPEFNFDLFEQTVNRNIAKYIVIMIQNNKFEPKYEQIIFDSVRKCYNAYINKDKMVNNPVPEMELYRYKILLFLNKEISYEEFVKFITDLINRYQTGSETLKAIASAFHYRAMLVVFVKNFGTGTKEENKEFIEKIVEDALVYLRSLKKDEDITFAYKEFFDLVSAVSFFDNGQNGFDLYLNLLKIQDVPTYVHSIGVAEITKALTKSLLESNPQEFICINNQYNTLDEVLNNKNQIIDLLYRGALLHDIGKTPLVDVISNCYRPLTDQEFILIKSHPAYSESIISDVFGSCIQDVAMFHHLSHDHKSGYPKVNDNFKSNNQIAIDILSVADTLEAATDNIGRTYKKSKTVEQIIVEMNSYPKDTRYSSLVLSAIKGETFNRIMTYLNVDRIKIYCKSIRELYDNTLIKMSDIKI